MFAKISVILKYVYKFGDDEEKGFTITREENLSSVRTFLAVCKHGKNCCLFL
jgi:hypothetical protein